MAKYAENIVKRIIDLIKSDSYTNAEICKQVDISEETFYTWKKQKPEFSESLKKARKERLKLFASEAEKSLLKKIRGYEIEETKTIYIARKDQREYGKDKAGIKQHTVIKKHIQPDTAAIIFALTNQSPKNWKNKQFNEHTGKNGEDLFKSFEYSKISTDKLKEVEKLLRDGEINQ